MIVPGRSGGPSDFNQWTRRPRTTEYGPIGPLSEGSGLWLGSGAAVPYGMLLFQGGKGDAVVRGVAVGCAVWGSVDGDGGVEKRVCPDAIDAPGDGNVRQAGATEKRLKSNADDAVRDGTEVRPVIENARSPMPVTAAPCTLSGMTISLSVPLYPGGCHNNAKG